MQESRSLNPPVVNAILVPNKCRAQHQSQSETWLEVEVSQRGKFYPQVYLDECLYELQMLEYDRIDISEGTDINKTKASSVKFVIIGTLKILVLNINHIFAMVVMV